ncbi:MAG: hypothetical protein ACW963_00305 [Candidatus Sifarchaeia archaeon]|jgi:hypothetical protein
MFKANGKLIYDNDKRRCIVTVDDGIGRFYRALIPKSQRWLKPRYDVHITVVRTGIETVSDDLWGYGDGMDISFTYDPYIWIGYKYIYLDAHSTDLEEVRESLGLPRLRMPHPSMTEARKCFHITIANMKF